MSQVTETKEGTRFPQTTSVYRCSNAACQEEKDKQTKKRQQQRDERQKETEKRAEEKLQEKRAKMEKYAAKE